MSVSYAAAAVTVTDGATSAVFTIKRSGTTAELSDETTLTYSTEDDTAVAGTDYTTTSGSLTYASGVTEQYVTVAIETDAYAGFATKTFYLELGTNGAFGAAIGAIQPTTTGSSTTQTYLYIPSDDDSVTVPTADSPGDNLTYQALYSDFSTPEDTTIEMPLAYFRLGYASSDLNEYERVILNSDNYHPDWASGASDTSPEEFGPMKNFSLPRPINRTDNSAEEQEILETDNAHLDGILMYSNASYSLTVAEQYSNIVKGDFIQEVKGKGRILWYDVRAEWVYFEDSTANLIATGSATVDGEKFYYTITNARQFKVSSTVEINYNIGVKYNLTLDAQFNFNNDAKYTVHNGIGLKVGGYEIDAECDVYGNYKANYPFGARASTKKMFSQAATDEVTLSIQPSATAWTTVISTAANLNAAAAAGIAIGDAITRFTADGAFYQSASPDSLDDDYTEAFATDIPDACVALGLVTAVAVALAVISQEIADLTTLTTPKLQMTKTGLTLACGATSMIEMTAAQITVTAPIVNFVASTSSGFTTPALTTSGTFAATGDITAPNLVAG